MAADSSTAATGSRSAGGGASADTYIGSLISLTSKSEIRYEGILYNISTEESSIGLRNVIYYGCKLMYAKNILCSEIIWYGRAEKDGPQVPPSDKIYEYILFRGSDIKDLQVKASPPVQTAPSINSDPAIIQSHYTRPTTPPTSLPTAPTGTLTDHGSHSAAQVGPPGSIFQSNLHLYQPGGNLNSWGPSPPNANGSGLAMPMYWQGFYGDSNGFPQLPQQSMLRPPLGLSVPPTMQPIPPSMQQPIPPFMQQPVPPFMQQPVPPSMQQIQFPGYSSSLPTTASSSSSSIMPDYHSSLLPNKASSSSLTSTSLTPSTSSLNVSSLQPTSLVYDIKPPNKAPTAIPLSSHGSSLASLAHLPASVTDNAALPSVASKPGAVPGSTVLPQQNISHTMTSFPGASGSALTESSTPSLVTPGQILQSGSSTVSASQPLLTAQKDVEVVKVSSEPPVLAMTEAQPPILPLPPNYRAQRPNGGAYHMRNNYRGRGGRGSGFSRPVAKFTEDFDFMAMNEKFKKDEVWGHLGKGNKSQSKDKEENGSGSEEELEDEDDAELPKTEIKSVYNKDDFFDSISCNSLDNDPNKGRTRYSEQMKLDTETFGEFSRYRGGRGGRGPGRGGGGRFRGSYYGRGYGGYGYVNRGRGGRGTQYRAL